MKTTMLGAGLGILLGVAFSGVAEAQIKANPGGLTSGATEPQSGSQGQIRLDRPVGGGGVGAPPAQSPAGTVSSYTIEAALALAKEIGFEKAEILQTEDKTRFVSGSINGVETAIYMINCKDANCGGIRFYAYFGQQGDVNLNFANAFNLDYIAKIIQTKKGNTTLLLDAPLYGGVSAAHMKEMGAIFIASIKSAMEYKPS